MTFVYDINVYFQQTCLCYYFTYQMLQAFLKYCTKILDFALCVLCDVLNVLKYVALVMEKSIKICYHYKTL